MATFLVYDYIIYKYISIWKHSPAISYHASWNRFTCVLKSHLRYDNPTCEVKVADASWNPTCVWESHLRSEDRRCVLKSHLRYENRTCEVKIADAFWNPAAAFWESHLRSEGRRCVLKTHLRHSLRRCDSHNAAAERSGTLTSAGGGVTFTYLSKLTL